MDIGALLKGKRVLVTGGTGSFGNQIVSSLVKMSVTEIVIASRDEKKHHDMACRFRDEANLLRFELADVRDYRRMKEVMSGIDVVYHAAALKQVPHCESYPFEAVKTNANGAENIRQAAISEGVDTVVAVSTDKAVKPVNVMGMTKALQERIFLQESNRRRSSTRFVCVRYGNVLGSRGSVVPYFAHLARHGKPLPVTHPEMTRFILTLSEAISLVFDATVLGKSGELFVRKMPAFRIVELAEIVGRRIGGRADYPVETIGVRPGEKIHEVLVSEEEMSRTEEGVDCYIVKPVRLGDSVGAASTAEYTSANTKMLTPRELEDVLERDGWFSGGRTESFDS